MSDELDENFIPEKEFPFREIMRWWEKRRKWFSLLVVAVVVLTIIIFVSNLAIMVIFILNKIYMAQI